MTMQFYRAFEDCYRGSRQVILDRLRTYQPFLDALLEQHRGAATLDLGCGRGEWLELLTEQGFRASGVDLDVDMLAACLERGLNATQEDALAALSSLPDESVALVSAFHLVEHIPFDTVRAIIDQAQRVLLPGGLLILETPNPENIVVGSSDFYTDPSHLRPIPPNLLGFAVEYGGLLRHVVMRLQEDPHLHTNPPLNLLSVLEGVSPDYSVVAQKAADQDLLQAFDPMFAATYGINLKTLAIRYEEQAEKRHAEIHHAIGALADRISTDRASTVAEHEGLRTQQIVERANQQSIQASNTTLHLAHHTLHAAHHQLIAEHQQLSAQQAVFAENNAHIAQASAQATLAIESVAGEVVALRQTAERSTELLATALARIETLEKAIPELQHANRDAEARWEIQHSNKADRHSAETGLETLSTRMDEIDALRDRLQEGDPRIDAFLAQANKLIVEQAQYISALTHSRSWRITSPLRRAGDLARRLRVPHASVQSRGKRLAIDFLRRSVQAILRRPRLKRIARAILTRVPAFQTRLRALLYRHDPDVQQMRPTPLVEPDLIPGAELPERTARIYRELKQAQQVRKQH